MQLRRADTEPGRAAGARLALIALVSFAVVAGGASADDLVTMRGNYYLEHATRVIQPSLDIEEDLTGRDTLDVHYLLDAITSASSIPTANPTAGGMPFSELRSEVGAGVTHAFDALRLSGIGRFSDESDYRSTFGTLAGSYDLFARDTTVSASFSDGHDIITEPGRINLMSVFHKTLDTQVATLGLTQILTPHLLATFDLEGSRLAGFQSNQYRFVYVAGTPVAEEDPQIRYRGVAAAGLRWMLPGYGTTLAPAYRFYRDNWDVTSHTAGLQIFQRLGATLLGRIEYRYYWQSAAFFYAPVYDAPIDGYATADPKLSAFTSHTFGANLDLALAGLRGGVFDFLSGGRLDLLYQYIVQHNRYGNANQAALGLTFPY